MKKHLFIIAAVLALVMMSTVLLCACAPASTPEKAEAALDKNGYSGTSTSLGVSLLAEGAQTVVFGSYAPENSDTTEGVIIVYFDSADHAKAAYNTIKEKKSALMTLAGIKESKEEGYWSFEISGKMIWFGTKAGVKAAR